MKNYRIEARNVRNARALMDVLERITDGEKINFIPDTSFYFWLVDGETEHFVFVESVESMGRILKIESYNGTVLLENDDGELRVLSYTPRKTESKSRTKIALEEIKHLFSSTVATFLALLAIVGILALGQYSQQKRNVEYCKQNPVQAMKLKHCRDLLGNSVSLTGDNGLVVTFSTQDKQ